MDHRNRRCLYWALCLAGLFLCGCQEENKTEEVREEGAAQGDQAVAEVDQVQAEPVAAEEGQAGAAAESVIVEKDQAASEEEPIVAKEGRIWAAEELVIEEEGQAVAEEDPTIAEEDQAGMETSPAVEPVAAKAVLSPVEVARERFAEIDLPDSIRLAAARELMTSDAEFLVEVYGQRDNARVVRTLIEERMGEKDADVLPLLLGLFEKVGGEERIDFENYVLYFGRRGEERMMELLRAEEQGLVMRAMDALAKMKSPAAVDSVARLLYHPEPWVRIGAAHAVGEIGGPDATRYLMATLEDSAYSVTNAALVGLGRMRAVEAYGRIAALAENDNPHVRKHAAIALGELGDGRGVPVVRNLAKNDPDSGVRFMAGKALQKLEGKQ